MIALMPGVPIFTNSEARAQEATPLVNGLVEGVATNVPGYLARGEKNDPELRS